MTKILALAVNPSNTRRLRIDREFRDIQLELSKIPACFFEFIVYGAIQHADISSLLSSHRPAILHFSGHGTEDALYVEDEQGRAASLDVKHVAGLVYPNHSLLLAIFNSCLSERLVAALSPHIPCVVGSTTKVNDDDAITFSRSFYGFLGQGYSVKHAFDLAIVQMNASGGTSEFIFASKSDVNPDNLYIPFSPKLVAKFTLSKTGQPKNAFGEYAIELFVHAVPAEVSEANYYYYNDFKKTRFLVNKDSRNKFHTNLSLYRDIHLRLTLWKSNGVEGFSSGCSLSEALINYYLLFPKEKTEPISRALADLQMRK